MREAESERATIRNIIFILPLPREKRPKIHPSLLPFTIFIIICAPNQVYPFQTKTILHFSEKQ